MGETRVGQPARDGGGLGIIVDVDGVLPFGSLRRELGRLRNLSRRSAADRRSVMGMPHLVRTLAADIADGTDVPVHYLTGLATRFARSVPAVLRRDGYPAGTVLTAPLTPGAVLGGRGAGKRAVLDGLLAARPQVRWVLVGDDGGVDPALFAGLADRAPERVAVIALRRAVLPDRELPHRVGPVPVVAAPNGEELLPQLQASLGIARPGGTGPHHWLLTAFERGNPATRLRAWTAGNQVAALVDGGEYFAAAHDALAAAGSGDTVLFAGWRADTDELLRPGQDAPTVGAVLRGAAARGARVQGLLWRSYPAALGYFRGVNRRLATELAAHGGRVLLDPGHRPFGCHHQKFLVVAHPDRPADDVAFAGGIDLATGRRDDADHRGDPQPTTSSRWYGPNPPWHDVQLELRGPAVRDLADVFAERWAARGESAPAVADPPPAGSCTVQILRTYPARPRRAFAPKGEHSIARGFGKALSRAERLVYVEDQYLWSFDVAVMFAAALHRTPRLNVVVVMPRYSDVERPLYLDAARLGHDEALGMVREAGGDRVQVLDVETDGGVPVYVHAKVCVVDDVWACVGSANLNMRSWTHDSELCAAILDEERDPRAPADPAGLGDGARRFARDLRLQLMREHLGQDDDRALLDPDEATKAVRLGAAVLDAWHDGGRVGPRPPGRLRTQRVAGPRSPGTDRLRWLAGPAYRTFVDPDGRSLGMRLRRTY